MTNFEQGENQLSKEGVVPPAAAEEALKAHQGELDDITEKAHKILAEHGGNIEIAMEEAKDNNDSAVLEKLQVMKNVKRTQE